MYACKGLIDSVSSQSQIAYLWRGKFFSKYTPTKSMTVMFESVFKPVSLNSETSHL